MIDVATVRLMGSRLWYRKRVLINNVTTANTVAHFFITTYYFIGNVNEKFNFVFQFILIIIGDKTAFSTYDSDDLRNSSHHSDTFYISMSCRCPWTRQVPHYIELNKINSALQWDKNSLKFIIKVTHSDCTSIIHSVSKPWQLLEMFFLFSLM